MDNESQAINQAGQDQLDRIAVKFEDWRRQKTSHSAKIPETLLHEALKLSQHLGATTVRRRLGITKQQMDKFDAAQQADQVTRESGFMQLVANNPQATPSELTIDIGLPTGVKISLSGLSHKDPLALIAKLIDLPTC